LFVLGEPKSCVGEYQGFKASAIVSPATLKQIGDRQRLSILSRVQVGLHDRINRQARFIVQI
jgi:hypothetical protein